MCFTNTQRNKMHLGIFFFRSFILLITISLLLGNSLIAQDFTQKQFTQKQKDSAFLIHPGQQRIQKIKKLFTAAFKNYTINEISLFGSMDLSKQSINDAAVAIPINYVYTSVNNNNYQTGYSGGFRMDGLYKQKHLYSYVFAINRVVVGNYYINKHSLTPFIEDFTHYKADNVFTTLSMAAHYKKLLPLSDMNRYKFYAVIGSSIDYKISKISNENLLNGAGNNTLINADIGAEFNNKGYYLLFAHYKYGINMFSSTVPIQLNRFEIGMSIKTKDLF